MHDAPHPDAAEDVGQLPLVLAAPMHEYRHEREPVARLWNACSYVELLLRLSVIVGLAELRERHDMTQALRAELRHGIDWPTLGKWQRMAERIAQHMSGAPDILVPELYRFVLDVLKPLLDGPRKPATPESSLAQLRNTIAHAWNARQRAPHWNQVWSERLDEASSAYPWQRDIALVVHEGPALRALRGPLGQPSEYLPGRESETKLRDMFAGDAPRHAEQVALVRGDCVLSLWPWMLYGPRRAADSEDPLAPAEPERLLHVYARRGETLPEYELFGSNEGGWSIGDMAGNEEFGKLFPPEQSRARRFESDIRSDAGRVVGREEQLHVIRSALEEARAPVFWFHGSAGVGKSYLLARLVTELSMKVESDGAAARQLILAYRFKVGQEGCTKGEFLAFVEERLEKWLRRSKVSRDLEGLTQLLAEADRAGRRVLLVLDGLDEIVSIDKCFAQQVPLALGPLFTRHVSWLCAGRPEVRQPFEEAQCCQILFSDEQGLPGLSDNGIRSMLLDMIGKKRNTLLAKDIERTSALFSVPWSKDQRLRHGVVPVILRNHFSGHGIVLRDTAVLEASDRDTWLINDGDRAVCYLVDVHDAELNVRQSEIVSPFIQQITEKSEGLPLYVRHVVNDILVGRLTGLGAVDGERLPRDLAEYQEQLLYRCTLGDIPKILTPLMSLIAVAKEPVSRHQLEALLNDPHRRLVSDRKQVPRLLEEALRRLSGLVLQRGVGNAFGYTVYHHSLRERMYASPHMQDSINTEIGWLCEEKCMQRKLHDRDPFKPYVIRHGVAHLVESGRYAAALDLLVRLWANTQETQRYLPVVQLDAFARLIACGLHDMLNVLHDPSTDQARRNELRQQARSLDPEQLARLLKRCFEIEPLKYGIRLLIEYHAKKWPAILDSLISPDDMVFRYTVGEALADVYGEPGGHRSSRKQDQLDAVLALARHSDINRKEVGCYALKFIYGRAYAEAPGLVERQHLEEFGSSEFYVERMILGELLISLALQGADVSRLVTARDFWQPIWDYHRLDIRDLGALVRAQGHMAATLASPNDLDAESADRERVEVEQGRTRLLAALDVDKTPVTAGLLKGYSALGMFPSRVRAAQDELKKALDTNVVLDIVRLLFMHPLWPVAESMASVLASVAAEDRALLPRVGAWLEQPGTHWRIRYGVLDFAFDIRHLDDHALFGRAVRLLHADPNCRVGAACASDLIGWILNSDLAQRRELLRKFEPEVGYWIRHAADCWLLDELHALCSVLYRDGCEDDIRKLLAQGTSAWLEQEPPFYRLDRARFLADIERKRRAEVAAMRSAPVDGAA